MSRDKRHSSEKYKDKQKPKIYNIMQERVEDFYKVFKSLPKFVPVTLDEYHLIEMAMGHPCLCKSNKSARERRKLSYRIHTTDILIVVMENVADGMDKDSKETSQLIHRLD